MHRVVTNFIFFVVSFIFVFTPYLRGLFFEVDFYLPQLILSVCFLVIVWCYLWKSEIGIHRYFVVLLIPFMYMVSLNTAVTIKGGIDNILRWMAYICLFLVVQAWKTFITRQDDSKWEEKILYYIFQTTGIWMVFFGILTLWGVVDFQDSMLGERMSGTFQYANTFAAVLGAFMLFSFIMLSRTRLPWYEVIFFTLPLVSFGVCILHSYSRGALVVFTFVWFVGLLFLKGLNQLMYVLYTILTALGSLIVFRQMVLDEGNSLPYPGWGSLLISTVVLITIALWIQKLCLNFVNVYRIFQTKFLDRLLIPITILFVSGALVVNFIHQGYVYHVLPESLKQRLVDIDTNTNSVVGRINVYKDALEMSKDSPWIGFGGEAWSVLYTKYQTLPYTNNETHNGYLEILVNTGWVGLVVFIVVFGYLFYRVADRIRTEKDPDKKLHVKAVLLALVMIFAHAAIDFDFSFGTVWFLIMWLFATVLPIVSVSYEDNASKKRIWFKAGLSLLFVFFMLIGVYQLRLYLAERTVVRLEGKLPLNDAIKIYEDVVTYNPYHVLHLTNLAGLYAQKFGISNDVTEKEKAITSLERALHLEPENHKVLFAAGEVYRKLGEPLRALEYYELTIKQDRFNPTYVDLLVEFETKLASYMAKSNDKVQALHFANKAISHYEEYQKLVEPFENMVVPDKRPLAVAQNTHLFVGQSYLMMGQFEKAMAVLTSVEDPNLASDVQALKVLILEHVGKTNEAAAITRSMMIKQPDFPQKVIDYKVGLLGWSLSK